MKKVALLVVGLVLCSVPLFAGEYLMNDTLRTVYGLRVIFSEPVSITSFGDVFTAVEPAGESTEFVFSGGELGSWDGHWFNWEPIAAQIVSYKWLAEGDSLSKTPLDFAAQDFTYEIPFDDLGVNLTIVRHIERNCLPFAVCYEITTPQSLDGYLMTWDVDKYVDSDGDGDPQNDRDVEGAVLDLVYVENYNPTVTLFITDQSGVPVLQWENMVHNDFAAGETVLLDGSKLLETYGLALSQDASFKWQQLHMEQNSLEYMTEYTADAGDPGDSMTSFTPQYAGRYVYSLEASIDGKVQVLQAAGWVVEEPTGAPTQLGIIMADVWNDWFDDEDNRVEGGGIWFSDEEALEKVRYLGESGFESISLNSAIVLERTLPDPLLTSEESNIPSDNDLRVVFSEITSPQLRVGSYVSLLADPQWGDPSAWMQFDHLPRTYFESFFQQYRERVLILAALAEEAGVTGINVGANHPYIWGIGGIDQANHSTGRYVSEQWLQIISDVREVFSGAVSITAIEPSDPAARPFVGVPDYVENLMGSYCYWGNCTQADRIAATRTAEDLRIALAAFYRAAAEPVSRGLGVPIAFQVAAASFQDAARLYGVHGHEQSAYDSWRPKFASGGYGGEILNGEAMAPFQPSFRDQALLLETFLPVLASMSSVDSIWLWGEYWKLLDFEDFAPQNALELHQADNVSLQGKPGFQVARLWASILDPNERLLYRNIPPVPQSVGEPLGPTVISVGPTDVGVIMAEEQDGVTTFQLALKPHAVIPYGDHLLVVDYAGDIYALDPLTGAYTRYTGVASHPFDGALSQDWLYVCQEDGLVLRLDASEMLASTIFTDLTRGENKELVLMGIEILDNSLYGLLLDEASASYFLCTYDLDSGVAQTKIPIASPASLGELVTLSSHEGMLYTVDWMSARGYSITLREQGEYALEQSFKVTDYVSESLWARGPRGFCWSPWGWVLTTTGHSAETPGRIHIVGELPNNELSRTASTSAETGTIVADKLDGVATFQVGLKPHAVSVYGDHLLIVDVAGDIYSLDPLSGTYTRYPGVAARPIDGALSQDWFYVCQEDGLVLRLDASERFAGTVLADLTRNENEDLVLMGIEGLDNSLYGLLLDEASASYFLCTYDLNSGSLRTKTPIRTPASLGEIATLCSHEGILYTVDWMRALGYSISREAQGEYALEEPFDLTKYVPESLWAQDPRGFCWSPWGWVLTTMGYSAGTPGKIHIVGDLPGEE